MQFWGATDVGRRRYNNEDRFVVSPELGFCAVADGMGGAASGEVASRIFVESALEVFRKGSRNPTNDPTALIQEAFRVANEGILEFVQSNPLSSGMGCTAEMFAFRGSDYVVGHVGDSRTYLFRQWQLRQLTRDHSLVQDHVDRGIISAADVRNHSMKHVILRAVGINETLAVDLVRGKVLPGDVFLLCSDGLTDMLEDSILEEILSQPLSLEERVGRLIDMAKDAGGADNITVVLCEVGA
ncbi:MAG: Stp1/IreP family PP2C-type Ser/Thr phosphatase [Chloroflexota bacterium]